jgi:hypothetical protein
MDPVCANRVLRGLLSADTFFRNDPTAVVPFLHDLCETVTAVIIPVAAIMMVMAVIVGATIIVHKDYGRGLGRKCCRCERGNSKCRSNKKFVHGGSEHFAFVQRL